MNSLPLISHHLFVSAIGHETSTPGQPGRNGVAGDTTPSVAKVIPLEVLAADRPLPAGGTRPLRAASSKGDRAG